jgi:hypothetical protein
MKYVLLYGIMENKRKMKITSDSKGESLKIYINDILHLSLIIDGLQIQSWRKNMNWFIIEFTTKKGVIISEYNDIEKWKSVLSLVDEIL